MEAHNGISAKIAENAGFKGIWASGLTISAQYGVRDNNEASWTQVLEMLEFMSDATSLPILVDGDTGHGNFNNMRRFVEKLEQRGIAGVCIEDKIFPKTNSFIAGERQELAEIEEFCGKIKAGKDTQLNSDFILIARTEAFITGWGLEEALRRAERYQAAGADAILVHSSKATPDEISAFMQAWNKKTPVVIVPTKYYATPTDYFRELGISLCIWANHSLRAAVTAMEETCASIVKNNSVMQIENKISSVNKIFELQGAAELAAAEDRYLGKQVEARSAIILAASRGVEFGELTANKPKALLNVQGLPIVEHIIKAFQNRNIKNISIVRGYQPEAFNYLSCNFFENPTYDSNKEVASLYAARAALKGEVLISFGDILFRDYFVDLLTEDRSDFALLAIPSQGNQKGYIDYISTDKPYSATHFNQAIKLESMSPTLEATKVTGEFTGLWKCSNKGSQILLKALEELNAQSDFQQLRMAELFKVILKQSPISVRFVEGGWLDLDSYVDLIKAGEI